MKARFLFVFAFICHLATQGQIITTIAGGGTVQPGDGGPATDCKLNEPIGIAVDPTGNIYIAERARHCIRKIDPLGTVTTIAGIWGIAGYTGDGGPATSAKLNEPYSIVLDAIGNIYFSEQLNFCIRKINTSGVISTIAGNGTVGYSGDGGPATNAQFAGAGFFALDNIGNIYVPDFDNHCVRKVDASGLISTIAGGNGVDGPGKTGDGGQATDAKMNRPQGVARDAVGNLYVAEYGSNIIRKITPSGVITTIAGTGHEGYNGEGIAASGAQLKKPLDVKVDQYDNLYVSEPYNYRVRKITPGGIISTVAGTGVNGSAGDGGPATAATFQTITGICFDSYSNLFISDGNVGKVRKVTNVANEIFNVFSNEPNIKLYPVPSNGNFTISLYDFETSIEFADFHMFSMDGRTIEERQISCNAETNIHVEVPSGIYVVSIVSGRKKFNQHISIVR